jgi:dihydrofolate synthase/folylpolyglutamate synthase
MFSRIGAAAYKADLTNTIQLCEHIGNPQQQLKTIHIAGTNGKGSTSHMLAAILQTAGYKTGLYTSPHLKDFRERIKVNSSMIPEETVTSFVQQLQPVIEKIHPSFFEITVAMAFDYFAKEKVDIAIIETGLGGRLDSTNIIFPDLSVITNISFDHQNMLGDTLQKIATEKAGIIKPGIPVIIGEQDKETAQVFIDKAAAENAPLIFASEKRYVSDWKYEHHQLVAEVTLSYDDSKEYYHLDLPGVYQTQNLVTVLETVHQLKVIGWQITDHHLKKALHQVKKLTGLHGRWELIREHPAVILDVGHNEAGVKAIVKQMELTTYHQLHIIIGMVKDKDIENVLALLPAAAHYYFTKAQIPRALPEQELAEKSREAGLNGHTYPDVNSALKAALTIAHKDDLLLVCGSVFLVGEVES